MARSSLNDVRSILDPLQSWNWDIVFPRIPGSSDTREMTFKAQQVTVPGVLLESVPVALHGVELRYAGRANYSHQMTATFIETRDVGTRSVFWNWKEAARSWRTNSGSYKSFYAVDIQLLLYDDLPQIVRTINVTGVFPENVDDMQMDGSASNLVTTSVTFSFDDVDN